MKIKYLPLLLIPVIAVSCKTKDDDNYTFSFDETSISISEEKTYQLNLNYENIKIKGDITYSSKDESIATISETGLVTALKEGVTQVIANYEDYYAVCAVTVTPYEPDATLSVSLSQYNYVLYKDDEFIINPTVTFGKETVTSYNVTSSINQTGNVVAIDYLTIKAVNSGEAIATLTFTYNDESVDTLIEIKVI